MRPNRTSELTHLHQYLPKSETYAQIPNLVKSHKAKSKIKVQTQVSKREKIN